MVSIYKKQKKKERTQAGSLTNTLLRETGWELANAEFFNFFTHTRHDMYGFIDRLAMKDSVLKAIQFGDISNNAEHIRMIKSHPNARKWLKTGNEIEVWSWRKVKKRDKDGKLTKKEIWKPLITKIVMKDLDSEIDVALREKLKKTQEFQRKSKEVIVESN